jgi:5'-nucleotidase
MLDSGLCRDVAQPGSAHAWGAWGRRFKSSRPDQCCFQGFSLKEILLTNDDGIQSPGISALAGALSALGRVTSVAPDREKSASSQSLSLHRPVRYEEIGPSRFSVDGTPTDCVLIALHHILKRPPDLVISGINRGANVGHDIAYSGTVSAAMEAAHHDVPAFAISLATRQEFRFEEAAKFAGMLAEKLWADPLPTGLILNVNVPSSRIRGIRITRQGQRTVRTLIVENQDPRGRKYFWFDQEMQPVSDQDSSDVDYIAVNAGFVSITPLKIDRTGYETIDRLRGWPEIFFQEKASLIR